MSDFRCPPMIDKESWEAQIDLTGLAVTIFTIISLKYPKIKRKVTIWREDGGGSSCQQTETTTQLRSATVMEQCSDLSLGEARGRLGRGYWFGPRVRSNASQNEFWLGLLDRLINFEPAKSADGHTTEDSCRMLQQLENELVDVFFNDAYEGTQLKARPMILHSELLDLHQFVASHTSQTSAQTSSNGHETPS